MFCPDAALFLHTTGTYCSLISHSLPPGRRIPARFSSPESVFMPNSAFSLRSGGPMLRAALLQPKLAGDRDHTKSPLCWGSGTGLKLCFGRKIFNPPKTIVTPKDPTQHHLILLHPKEGSVGSGVSCCNGQERKSHPPVTFRRHLAN